MKRPESSLDYLWDISSETIYQESLRDAINQIDDYFDYLENEIKELKLANLTLQSRLENRN